MSGKDIKLGLNDGVRLQPTATPGISYAVVVDEEKRFDLTWDRFLRLHNTAESIKKRADNSESILDVGGFDGALALFLPGYKIDVIDPLTTDGSGHSVETDSYDVIVSIDALEHVHPNQRQALVHCLGKAARHLLFINFPGRQTAAAQQLVFELTNNPLVKEHVIWQLPDLNEVRAWVEECGFRVDTRQHTGLAQWVSQYLLQTVAPQVAAKANRYLLEHHLGDPVGAAIYDLVIAEKLR